MTGLSSVHIDDVHYQAENTPEAVVVNADDLHIWINGKHFVETELSGTPEQGDHLIDLGLESGIIKFFEISEITDYPHAKIEIYYQADTTGTSVSPNAPDEPIIDGIDIEYMSGLIENGGIVAVDRIND